MLSKKFSEVAVIDEAACIRCAKCLDACPVDAIIGAFRMMHTAIREECIGCRLCVPPCPIDCIQMIPCEPSPNPLLKAKRAHERVQARKKRLTSQAEAREQARLHALSIPKKEVIRKILERARRKEM